MEGRALRLERKGQMAENQGKAYGRREGERRLEGKRKMLAWSPLDGGGEENVCRSNSKGEKGKGRLSVLGLAIGVVKKVGP